MERSGQLACRPGLLPEVVAPWAHIWPYPSRTISLGMNVTAVQTSRIAGQGTSWLTATDRECPLATYPSGRQRARCCGRADLLIRRVCHASLLPGHMPPGLRGYRSLACVVSRSYAVLYGQNQATGTAHGSAGGRPPAALPCVVRCTMGPWPASGPQSARPITATADLEPGTQWHSQREGTGVGLTAFCNSTWPPPRLSPALPVARAAATDPHSCQIRDP